MSQQKCAAHRSGWAETGLGARRLPCVRDVMHGGAHRDRLGASWVEHVPAPVASDDELTQFRADELAQLQALERALWARVWAGEDTAYLRQRLGRIEALRAALCGFPVAIAADPPCSHQLAS